MTFDNRYPLVLGLAGQACTGKTVTAEGLCPQGGIASDETSSEYINWSHLFFAIPIYRIATAKQKIQGARRQDRVLYEIHNVLFDLFGQSVLFGALPSYNDFIDLVHYVDGMACEAEGEKPRSFLQSLGSLCREYDQDCFVNWAERRISEEFRLHNKTGVVVSDVRFPNEAKMIADHPNGIVIKFVASAETRALRALARDGKQLDASQTIHESESATDLIPASSIDRIVETDNLTVKDQVNVTRSIVNDLAFNKVDLFSGTI